MPFPSFFFYLLTEEKYKCSLKSCFFIRQVFSFFNIPRLTDKSLSLMIICTREQGVTLGDKSEYKVNC